MSKAGHVPATDAPAEAASLAGAAAASYSPVLPLIIGGALMIQSLNTTIIVNALPTMGRALGHDAVDMNVTITAYLLASAVFLPLSGWMADRFGTRAVFRWAIIVYLLSNVACGLAQTLPQLLAARILGGAASALMTPVGRLVILRTAPKHELVRAMSYLTMPVMLGPVLGPPIGGLIVTYWSWRWIFFVNIPIGLLAIVLVTRCVPDIREHLRIRLDMRGALLTGIGLAALIFGLQNLGHGTLSLGVALGLVALGSLLLAAYRLHARRIEAPILDFALFRVPTFAAGVIGGQFVRVLNGAMPFLLALQLQIGFGMSALASGLLTFTSAVAALLMKTTTRPILKWLGFRNVLVANSLIIAVTFSSYALFDARTPHVVIVALLFAGGFFRSLQFTSLNTVAYADLPESRMSSGSTLLAMSQPLAQSVGVALAASAIQLLTWYQGADAARASAIGPVFALLGGASLLSLPYFLALSRTAGEGLTGHRARPRAHPEAR